MAPIKAVLIVLLHGVFQFALCRDVTLPIGPLYRVAGFPVSLPCVVSEYEGSRKQDFEWFLYRDDAGGRQMGVISTRDPGFPYAPFQSRVRNGEVRVERDSDARVRLVIHRLRTEDQGRYECYTPSTDSTFQGNYSSLVTVKVIPDTLQISYSRSLTGQPLPQGAELTLTCSASIQSEQLTHLSVMFGKRGETSDRDAEIISIDKMLGIVPGSSYQKRYDDGEISLEKRNVEGGQDLYVMKMRGVRAEDRGSYFCEASQWIRDPDRSWQKIAQRTLDIGNLTVNELDDIIKVMPTPQGVLTLQIGAPLLLTCEVQGLPSQINYGLLVQWLVNDGTRSKEVGLVWITPAGVVSWGDELSQGRGSLEKVSEGRYTLKLFSVQPADSGSYRCAVSFYAPDISLSPSTAPIYSQHSEAVTVNLRTKDVRVFAVVQLPRGPLLKRGSTITLICNVTIVTTGPVQAQVQWVRSLIPKLVMKKDQSPSSDISIPDQPIEVTPEPVATLRHDGVTQVFSNSSEVSVDRLTVSSYRLRVHVARPADQGLYACHVHAWGQDPHGAWYNTGVKAESNTVTVYLYARVEDLLLIPLVVGVSSALFVGIVIISTVTCCFMRRLAKQRARK
ncbi:immunoglobulin superfamily member 8 [Boleophthalmus pectinirostris]|uniref:immunoglobulin superfamily member 8 n=1 Tax=Boleophthalmus pectinirostris TaxID=150288 RepID=UPI000A1C4006|nr:immunoglobulin superfamily member 8 [Boleophthalmus pectinirostris]